MRRVSVGGEREDLATLFARQPRGNQRSAAPRRFDDDRAEAQAADDPVTLGEMGLVRVEFKWELGDQRTAGSYVMGERTIGGRVDPVDAVPEHRNRPSAGVQRATVSGCVDALGEPADDDEAVAGKVLGKVVRVAGAAAGWVATADNRKCGQAQKRRVAVDVKQQWRVRDAGE